MREAALKNFAERMARAVDEQRISTAQARSVLGQAVLDAAGRGDVVPAGTRVRNAQRVKHVLREELV